MSTMAKEIIDHVSQRVRDPQNTAHSRALVRALVDRAQTLVNASRPGLVLQANLVTQPRQVLYPVVQFADGQAIDRPFLIRVVRVMDFYRDLVPMTWRQMAMLDRRWLRRTADTFQGFAPIGRDWIAIYPAKNHIDSVQVLYAVLPTPLTSEDTIMDLRDDRLPAVTALAEMFLLLRQRNLGAIKQAVERYTRIMSGLPPVHGTGVAGWGLGGTGIGIGGGGGQQP